MKRFLITYILILVGVNLFAIDARLANANQLYSSGKFTESVTAYEDILKSGVESEAVYFNLGNAYYKTGKLPNAILNYERALLLDPDDKDIAYNLDLANSQITDRINDVERFFLASWFSGLISKGTSDFWAWTSIIAFIIGLSGLGLFFYTSNFALKRTSFYTGIAFVVITVFAISFSNQQEQMLTERTGAIVFTPTVNVKSSPDLTGKDLFVIHEGTKVTILEREGSWRKIQLKDGSQGWLESSTIEVI